MSADDDGWTPGLWAELERQAMNGRVGQDLLSETDEVRVWRIVLAPGERIGFHRHVLRYFWVAVNAGRSRSRHADGTVRETAYAAGETRHYAFGPGEFMLHDLENVGDTDLVFTTVEFKASPNPPLPLA